MPHAYSKTRQFTSLLALLIAAGCSQIPTRPNPVAQKETPCVPCKEATPAKPAEPPLQAATYADLPGWADDDLQSAFQAFVTECASLQKQPLWKSTCASARSLEPNADLRSWFEVQLRPWQLVNPDGNRDGLITGYYEPILQGSRTKKEPYTTPVFTTPDDLITVDLGDLYPELKHMRLRGRLEGKKLVPYYSRAEWSLQED
ncbi:MAG TPA: MltA domain-containing protein, partial [Rhodocyclaceae bacterium]|nr:MltA domain-containing protein [Rhodocyclaceae bacterium]